MFENVFRYRPRARPDSFHEAPSSRPSFLPPSSRTRWLGLQLAIKCLSDSVFSAFALIALCPAMLFIAVLVRRSTGGSALIELTSIGRHGDNFGRLFYRTRTAHGHQTALGTYLERSGLAGLPQLINVFRGEMSLVGPMPGTSADRMRMIGQPAGAAAQYFPIKPGLLGWIGERDADYGENFSLLFDGKILVWALSRRLSGARKSQNSSIGRD